MRAGMRALAASATPPSMRSIVTSFAVSDRALVAVTAGAATGLPADFGLGFAAFGFAAFFVDDVWRMVAGAGAPKAVG